MRAVFGYGGAGSGEWSEPREFRVTSTALPPPAAVAPLPSEATASSGSLLAPADELRSVDWRGISEQIHDAVLPAAPGEPLHHDNCLRRA